MNKIELKEILANHKKWLNNEDGEERANLWGADLWGANLRGANLCEADLRGADLHGAISILSISPIGSRGDATYAVLGSPSVMVKTGCFWGTVPEFLIQVEKTHTGKHLAIYRSAIELINVWVANQGE